MKNARNVLVTVLSMACVVIGVSSNAATEVLFTKSWGADKVRKIRKNVNVVVDKTAPEGKSLRLNYTKPNEWSWNIFTGKTKSKMAGDVKIDFSLRAEGLLGLSEGLRLRIVLKNLDTNRIHNGHTLVQGIRTAPGKIINLPVSMRLDAKPARYFIALHCQWVEPEPTIKPVVWINKLDISGSNGKNAYISGLDCERNAYHPGETIKATIWLSNPGKAGFKGKIVLQENSALTHSVKVAEKNVDLKPNETTKLSLNWLAKGDNSGRELIATLRGANNSKASVMKTLYGVAVDPSVLCTIPTYTREHGHGNYSSAFYVGPESYSKLKRSVAFYKKRKTQRMELFSWSFNELASMMPPKDEEPYLGNEGIWWQSLKKMKTQLKLLNDLGIEMVTYINGHLWGPAAYSLYQKHPEWFVYTKKGELLGDSYNMEDKAKYERRGEFEFRQFKHPFFYGNLNPTLPEVRRFFAAEIVKTAKEMGFDGVRWDVWSMDVKPEMYDIQGKPLATSWSDADTKWAASIAAIKSLVAKEIPGFTWGYNYCSPDENRNTPKVLIEKCKDGGWMLDEVVCSYAEKTSPYHKWRLYSKYMAEWGNHILRLGGIYNPFALHRGGGKYPVDRLYEGIFRIIGGARFYDSVYSDNASKVGRLGKMAFRFNNIFSGPNLRIMPPDQKTVNVKQSDKLWWKGFVFSNTGQNGKKQIIAHLVNPPVLEEIEENPESKINPPVENIEVSCAKVNGKSPTAAWLVSAESQTPKDEPKVKAIPLKIRKSTKNGSISVVVPSVLYWKTVVFEF